MKKIIVFCLLLATTGVQAQDSINAERPGFSSSPLTLDQGRWQLEGGYQYQRIGSGVDAQALPLMLLRYGAGERAEIQLNWSGFNRIDTGPQTIDGSTDGRNQD